MENIIKKAIEGGYEGDEYGGEYTIQDYLYSKEKVVLDPLFWQALFKPSGKFDCSFCPICENSYKCNKWGYYALKFYEINLTQGWDKAVEYLEDLIK